MDPLHRATDYYRVLGVKPDATAEEIHCAYRHLARAYHPDIHPGSAEASIRMARLNAAKSVLLDPRARAAYDLGRNGAHPRVRQVRAEPKRTGRFDFGTAMMLIVVGPLVLGALVYFVTGVQVAVRPLPLLTF
jgi:DnaJ-class molecular chaperone